MKEIKNFEDQEFCGEKPYSFSLPTAMGQHFEFIDINQDGNLLLGSSNLVLNFWNGSIWYFKDADVVPLEEHSIAHFAFDYSVACGEMFDKNKIIVGNDSGEICILHAMSFDGSATTNIVSQLTSLHHDSSITSLSVLPSNTQSVSAGSDLAINIWDNETLISKHKYMPAHSKSISCVKVCNEESPIFASSSLDGSALLWDPRLQEPASCIKESHNCGLTTLSWKNGNEIAIGDEFGRISINDVRVRKDIFEDSIMECSIHKIIFNNKGLLGVCGDSPTVKIWNSHNNKIIYSEKRHTSLVRGLAWHPISHKLYSCGFDKNIHSHQVIDTES